MTPVPCRFGFPNLGFGLGLRTPHYSQILEERPPVDWFEIISENFMGMGGRPRRILDEVREHYPIVMHGVSMSIGTTDPIDFEYLKLLKALADRIGVMWLSDHLCWTGVARRNAHDLLPVPYTEEVLKHVVERIRIIQDFMERPLSLENPSTYVEFKSTSMSEWEFISRMAEDGDCGLLLDINNIYVSCFNHGWDPHEYLANIPHDRVVQYHLAGHTNKGTHIIDTHDDHVVDEVWDLYEEAWRYTGGRSTLLEWDGNIPSFEVTHAEVLKAKARVAHLPTIANEEVPSV